MTFVTADRVQHVLLLNAGRRLQLAITGERVAKPVRLFVEALALRPQFDRRLLLLRRLSRLIEHGNLLPRFHPPDPRSRRLAFVLQALDGALAPASQRELALALFGRRRTEADWRDPGGHLRDRVRRAVRRGRLLMQRGYLHFLE